MGNHKIKDMLAAWEIFMGLCEEFPELYDAYVEKAEKDMAGYEPAFKPTEEDRMRAYREVLKMAGSGSGN